MPVASFPNGNYQLDHDSAQSSQNWGANQSSVYFRTIVRKLSGSGYWGSDGWWVITESNMGRVGDSSGGSYTFQNGSNSGEWWIHEGNFIVPHDAKGYANYQTRAQARYGAIGTSPWVDTGVRSLARIPKRPSIPGTPQFSNVLPTSLSVSWAGSSDHAGSPVDGYLLRYWPNAEATGPYTDHSQQNNTSRVVTGLQPGTWYRFRVYAHNGSADNGGYSNPSGDAVIRMISGGRVRVGGVYKTAIPYQRVSGAYKLVLPFVRSGGVYKNTQ